MTYRDLQKRLHDEPFRAFRIRMVNNTTYDIIEPWMIMVGRSSAVIASRIERYRDGYPLVTDWRTVSIPLMIEFSDIERKESPRKKRPA
jgi:hypothetical protein